jgi:hypothetical protein
MLAVIGGLITSTILSLMLAPTAYSLVEGALARYQGWKEDRAARLAAREAAGQRAKESTTA